MLAGFASSALITTSFAQSRIALPEVKSGIGSISVKDYGAIGDGIADDTRAIQSAIDSGKRVLLPIGIYKITKTLREATNGGALNIVGEHRKFSIISSAGLNAPTIWVGNSNGHGNYRCEFTNFTIDGVDRVASSVGLVLHEAGTSHIHDIDIKNVETLCQAVGVIGTLIGGKCEWGPSTNGLIFFAPKKGTPSSTNDLTTTASPLTLNTNANVVENIWFTAVAGDVIVIDGGLTNIKGVVLQSCGSNVNRDLITFNSANEHFDFGDGSSFEGWIEGGSYRYAIAIRKTNGAKIGGNTFIAGSSSPNPTNRPKEGAIFKDALSQNTVLHKGISIWGFFVSPPTEGRHVNASVYTIGSLMREDVFSPRAPKTQITPYYQNLTNPKTQRGHNDFEIILTTLSTTPTVSHDSHGIVSSVKRSSAGDYTINFNFNRLEMPSYHVDVQARTASISGTVHASCFGYGNASSERVIVTNQLGVLTDPAALTLLFKSQWQGV